MSTQITGSTSKNGCGGSGSDCHCGQASCEHCRLEGFVRPRFFPGQLLTEEDLQLLDAYAVAKNRLHNRHFWGDGVVCGLAVAKHPCEKGSVIVSPGYALDCCGNDIVVACPQELDVNRLVRELRTRLRGGYDCGDPCPPGLKQKAVETGTSPPPKVSGAGTTTTTNEDVPKPLKFCLYLSYCELESDPVAPYATGDPCGVSGCEPSRIREGFRFELRCDDDPPPRSTIQEAFCRCLKDKPKVDQAVNAVEFAKRARARLTLQADDPVAALTAANKQLTDLGSIDARNLDAALRAAEQALILGARVSASDATKGKTKAVVDAARAQLAAIAGVADQDAVTQELAKRTTLERTEAEAILSAAKRFADNKVDDDERTRLAAGNISTPELNDAVTRVVGDFRPAVEPRLPTIVVPPQTFSSSVEVIDVSHLQQLEAEIDRVFRDCLCNAVLPPCARCTDLGVRIACITIRDCAVIDICNVERRFVLTPLNLRYWTPDIDTTGALLEAACCGEPDSKSDQPAKRSLLAAEVFRYWMSLFGNCGVDEKSLGAIIRLEQSGGLEDRFSGIERRLQKLENK